MHPSIEIFFPFAAALVLSGCAGNRIASPDVPASLRPPRGMVAFLATSAAGFQIYECISKSEQAPDYAWVFRAPDATLTDSKGQPFGKHFSGPTWQAADGSAVVGEVKAKDAGPDPGAVAWLLLGVKSTSGAGALSPAKYIQRVQTVGGVAPSEPCTAENAHRMARIPYTATYYFYRSEKD